MVTFPSLNLNIELNKIAFNLFGIAIYWYAVLIVLAFCIAVILFKIRDGLYKINYEDILTLMIYAIPICFITARLYYVLFKWDYFSTNLTQIFNIKQGGLAIYGGIIGGFIVSFAYCKKNKIKLLDLTDYIVPALSLGQAIGRWGNFINIEAYGKNTDNLLRMGIVENGIYKEVHPCFLYESITTFILFIILWKTQKRRKFSGEITYIYLIIYSFARFLIEGLRTDSLMIGNYRISQIISIMICSISCYLMWKNVKLKDKKQQTGTK